MSCRPRPVTATINHKPQFESTPLRSDRSYSPYSTGDSTHSLISILDHDSFEELDEDPLKGKNKKEGTKVNRGNETFDKDDLAVTDEDDDGNSTERLASGDRGREKEGVEENRSPVNEEKEEAKKTSPDKTKSDVKPTPVCRKSKKQVENSDIKNDLIKSLDKINLKGLIEDSERSEIEKSSITDQEKSLSPWEKWLIVKAREERERLAEMQRIKERKKWELKQKEKQKLEQLKKAEEARRQWEEKKLRAERMEKMTVEQREKLANEVKAKEKRHTEVKAKQKYEEWLRMKKEEEVKRKAAEEEKKRVEDEKRLARKASSEKAFIQWKEKASQRPKSSPSGYAFSAGKLMGYYDRTSYPAPGYYNPIPWQPVSCPSQPSQPTRKPRRTGKPRKPWDPSKYY